MYYTDDPISDFKNHDIDQQRKLERLPVCNRCGERIQQECAVLLDEWYCDDCLRNARTPIETDW